MDTQQDELERLRRENAELKRALDNKQQLVQSKSLPSPQSLISDHGFIEDMSRFAEGVLSEKQVRQKYHLFNESDWTALNDDALVEKIELRRTERVRLGLTKKELAQNYVIAGPGILNDLMTDPKQSAKHRIDAVARLDALTGDTPQAAADQDRILVTINLSGEKIQIGGTVRPTPNDSNHEIVDVTPSQIQSVDEPPPPKRGPGRPPGSKNKPKTSNLDDAPLLLPGFAITEG